jgi:hypothetical protein
MFSMIRGLVLLVICLVGVGVYRGWFSLSNPSRDAEGSKVNVSVSLDTAKFEADLDELEEALEEEIAERVAQRTTHSDDKTPSQDVK